MVPNITLYGTQYGTQYNILCILIFVFAITYYAYLSLCLLTCMACSCDIIRGTSPTICNESAFQDLTYSSWIIIIQLGISARNLAWTRGMLELHYILVCVISQLVCIHSAVTISVFVTVGDDGLCTRWFECRLPVAILYPYIGE